MRSNPGARRGLKFGPNSKYIKYFCQRKIFSLQSFSIQFVRWTGQMPTYLMASCVRVLPRVREQPTRRQSRQRRFQIRLRGLLNNSELLVKI
jgi:hypothetical protein